VARAFVGLGSNIGDREALLRRALDAIAELPGTQVRAVSSFRDTAPVGIVDQPRFLNAAAELETSLQPRALLSALLEIERRLGSPSGASSWSRSPSWTLGSKSPQKAGSRLFWRS
jgi:2-amino-4-hydroxy-6-hydroxymethyldihydropteridine diphosphokinase